MTIDSSFIRHSSGPFIRLIFFIHTLSGNFFSSKQSTLCLSTKRHLLNIFPSLACFLESDLSLPHSAQPAIPICFRPIFTAFSLHRVLMVPFLRRLVFLSEPAVSAAVLLFSFLQVPLYWVCLVPSPPYPSRLLPIHHPGTC